MANLDIAFRRAAQSDSTGDELEQLLLLTTDGLDSSGFLEHLKLPHYVTFRSIVDRKLASRAALADSERAAGQSERGQDNGPGAEGPRADGTGTEDTGDRAGPAASEMGAAGEKQPSFGGNF
jgi:hypothetical protein